MFDSFFVDHLLSEHMAEVRRREATRALLGPAPPRRRRRPGLIERLVRAVAIPAMRSRTEKRVSQ